MARLALTALWLASACLDTPPTSGQPDAGLDPDVLRWQRPLERTRALVGTHDGDVILVGAMLGDVPFEPASESFGRYDALIARLDAGDGHTLFADRHGNDLPLEIPNALAIKPDGGIVAAGIYSGGDANLTGVDLTAPGAGRWHTFFAAYGSDGEPEWSTAATGTGVAVGPGGSMFLDGNGHLRVGGSFTGGAITIPPLDSPIADETDGFISIVEEDLAEGTAAAGDLDVLSADGEQSVTAVHSDQAGGMYVVGISTGPFMIAGEDVAADGVGADLFVVRQNLGGSVVHWTNVIGGTGEVSQVWSATTSDGDLVVAAAFTGELEIETAEGTAGTYVAKGGTDVILIRLEHDDGTVSWARDYGGTLDDTPRFLAVGPGDRIAVTGLFRGTSQFGGANLVAADEVDGFLALYGSDGSHVWSAGFGGTGDDSGYGVAFSTDGALYLTALFTQHVDFGDGPLTSDDGVERGVLVKLAPP